MDNHTEVKNQDLTKKSPFDDLSRDDLISKCKGLLVIAQKAKQAKSELQNEIDKYKNLLQVSETEKKLALNNLQTLQELVDSLTEQKLIFITEIDTAHNNVKALNKKCDDYEEEVNKQKACLILKDNTYAIASQKLSDLDSEVISLKRQNKRLLEENDQLINQLAELEARTEEFNCIGLEQREQLRILEEKIQHDNSNQLKIEELTYKIRDLETIKVKKLEDESKEESEKFKQSQNTIEELRKLYESEKAKKDKTNVKLRSYKDKILKCANCINQLKNSRLILTKTIKEYSENIPKWQTEIIQASKILDGQIQQLNNENILLKTKLQAKENECNEISANQGPLYNELSQTKQEKDGLVFQVVELKKQLGESLNINEILQNDIMLLKNKNIEVYDKKQTHTEFTQENDTEENNILQLKALELEKSILVKEKLNAKDTIIQLENENKKITDERNELKLELKTLNEQLASLSIENMKIKEENKLQKKNDVHEFKNEMISINEKFERLKKEYDNLHDLNALLQEEVETLKLSLEQPKDDAEHLSDLNVSLQADIVKLETKLSAYKQENASLLIEVKESRSKVKDFDNLASEYENAKSKLVNYKTENAELLNEMKEINQVLKERGEAISKLQKAVSEMERLIETLEKDRDNIKEEKEDLLKKIENLESDLKNAENNCTKTRQEEEKSLLERDNLLKSVHEKEIVISGLKEDLDKLKQQFYGSVELPNEDMSTSTISKAEDNARMKDLDETFEDKYTKLRMFALKLKKKLNETTTQLQTSDQEKTKLKKLLVNYTSDNKQKPLLNEDTLDGCKNIEKELQNVDFTDLKTKLKILSDDFEASTVKLQTLEADIEMKNQQLAIEIECHKNTKEQLEKALKDVKKKNVLSLEMEDYERSMKDLTAKMEENKKKIIQMESTIDSQEGTITAMKTQIKLLEEQIKSEETQNRLLKEELHQALEEGKEKDSLINAKKEIVMKLMQELENEKRKKEEADLEITSILSEKEKIIINFADERLELNSKMKKLEFKNAELNEKFKITNIELADLKTEYTSYKVRAQAVLRQNQTIDHSQEEQLKEEAAALKTHAETLSQKLTTLQDQYSELSAEVEVGRKRLSEATAEAGRAHQRTARLQVDLTRLSQQLESERSQHKLQVSTLTQCYKTQISELETKLLQETESLKKQILISQESSKAGVESNRDKYMLPVILREEDSDNEMDINVSLIPREEGEGSESAPSPPLSKSLLASSDRRSPVPLERLLEEGVPENDSLDTSSLALTADQEIAELRRKITAQQQRVKHVTVLLAESEREGARLAQLSELLKAELRRVRASANNAHNTEYMKNVTLKFLTLPPGDERSRLVPVLQKILTLSSEEIQKIQAIAKGQDPNPSKGWGSYLPWPGGK